MTWLNLLGLVHTDLPLAVASLGTRLGDKAENFAHFCIFAEIVENRTSSQEVMVELARGGEYRIALEALMCRLAEAQSNLSSVVLSFEFSRKLIELNTCREAFYAMTLNQMHMALEVRYHYLLKEEEAFIADLMIEVWGDPGAAAVRALAKQSDRRERLLNVLGARPA